ncbi:hypothetical protein NP233_g11278 [Leucocoprinus birnbaumii]|uniref:Uncharacterized protein n=1 Tax=Leucocoprinus birnbaumii TaxID=56174 RepID=A0AAD5VHP1_9AGAR|nr:hypothetical protein NP233_g11278 [Leucocoprinus birnbaumii]
MSINIWSSALDLVPESSSPRLPPQSPKLQKAWAPRLCPKDRTLSDSLAHARVRAIFRSSRFPNRIDNTSTPYDDLEPDDLVGVGPNFTFDEGDDHPGSASGVLPDFDDEHLFDPEESFSSNGSSLSSRSTPMQDWTPHWHPHLCAVLSSRSKDECINACRVLVLSTEWEHEQLAELAYQLVSSVMTAVPPPFVAACASNIKRTLLDASKHEAASLFVSCMSESAFIAWHHYWNPDSDFSIYPGRHFKVTKQHMDAAYTVCRLLGSLFKSKIVSRASVREVVDLTLQNAVLLEHIDALGNLLSYATPEFWVDASEDEKNRTVIELCDVVEWLCEYHFLRPELVKEYEKKVEEICAKMLVPSW